MKQLNLKSYKESGFTLLESLIGLMLFSIVILGSGAAISKMMTAQKDLNTNSIIINMMQKKLQNALNNTATGSVCNAVNKDSFVLANKTYYTACAIETINMGTTDTEWPVLAVSTTLAEAQTCANGTASDNCYVVGR
ncbi:type II secretion system protein [Acinetobacter tianfuensis]|uniref:Type II secretion system protein n=1 Tax=Acinetobacter tianfuensis TaxID=2419603 RepID=A0A3A8EMW3_9GAMM|nr:type II secretion system protein [Acinetobacter tianfuensis]RKG32090.1 type II secretion system protein [Acinetobacter tianfuensis]